MTVCASCASAGSCPKPVKTRALLTILQKYHMNTRCFSIFLLGRKDMSHPKDNQEFDPVFGGSHVETRQ